MWHLLGSTKYINGTKRQYVYYKDYHSSRVIVISMNTEHRQANIEMRIFIVYMTKPEQNDILQLKTDPLCTPWL